MDGTSRPTKGWQWQLLAEEKNQPSYLNPQDTCYFLDYHYSYLDKPNHDMSNQIGNFKKPVERKSNQKEWYYRDQAVKLFAKHLAIFLQSCSDIHIMAIPSSKKPDHPEYNHRFEDLFDSLAKQQAIPINIVMPINLKESTVAAHAGGERTIQGLLKNYLWQAKDLSSINHLLVCDDVITSGAHFRAVSDFLHQNGYTNKITGLFFALHTYADHND